MDCYSTLFQNDQNPESVCHYTDINECETNNRVCGTGATCKNTIGSFTCTRICLPGYTSDGKHCVGKLDQLTICTIFVFVHIIIQVSMCHKH